MGAVIVREGQLKKVLMKLQDVTLRLKSGARLMCLPSREKIKNSTSERWILLVCKRQTALQAYAALLKAQQFP